LFGEVSADAGEGDGLTELPISASEWDKTTLLAFEREMLSLYVSDHPLLGIEHVLAQHADAKISDLTTEAAQEGSVVTVAGILSGLARKTTKAGAAWAQATLEDLEGAIGVMFFPGSYATCAVLLAEDAVVVVKGKLDRREDEAKLIAIEVTRPDLSQAPRGPVLLRLEATRCTEPVVASMQEVLRSHPGLTEVHLHLVSGQKTTVLKLDDGLRVSASPSLFADLKQLLGSSCLG
ncbi:MAG TPA: OB-fold nucleic acid binding domain-containing protein, partial [Mycobacteriales bacterium]|nr:OB-fold nucleic acid binding domain-containing protein [Mycobacteriales bacterium]